MTDTLLLALITAAPATLAALCGLYVGLRNGRKVDGVDAKTIEIHTLTNSQLARVTSSLEVANTKIEGLEKLVALMVDAKMLADKNLIEHKE